MASTKHESSPKPSIKTQALVELTVAGALWGFGFIGTVWALRFLHPSAILFYRFSLAFVGGMVILWSARFQKKQMLHELSLSLIPGAILWLTLIFQTWGLKHTTATNSTFITTLYVVLVPLVHSWTGEDRLSWIHWLCVILALIGTGFIVQIQNLSALNWGDFLTLICAIFAALHIIVVGQRAQSTSHDFAFNTFQSFWVAFFSLLLFPFSSRWQVGGMDVEAWTGILSLGFGASMIAFYLQVKSQKVLSPSVASLLFLLESPASCFFAYLLLRERMSIWQWTGAGMILLSCAIISFFKTEKTEHSI